MAYLVFLAMSLLAGAWLLPLTRGDWSLDARLALCIALSPFVVAFQAIVLLALGVSLGPLSSGLLVVNCIPAVFVVQEWRSQPGRIRLPNDIAPALLAAAIPLVWLIASWWLIPDLRAFGWHNLLHSDIVYQLSQRGLRPEEPELAGLPLAYSWFGHAYWMVASHVSDRPPTRLFPLQNLALLGALMVLIYGAARRMGVHAAFAILAAVLAVFGNNLVREIAGFTTISDEDLLALAGEKRLVSPLTKFRSLDLMPASFALYAGVLALWAARESLSRRCFTGLQGLLLTASALFYPVGFPAVLCLSGSMAFLEIAWSSSETGARRAALRRAGGVVAGAAVAAGSLGLWAHFTQMGGAGAVATVRPLGELSHRVLHLASAVGPFALLALPGLWRSVRTRNAFVAALGLSALLMLGVYAVFEVRHVEYKYVHYARLGLGVVIAYGLQPRFSSRARSPWAVALALLLALATLSFSRVSSVGVPPSLLHAPPIDESSFEIQLAENSPHAGWTRAIREQTPPDTVVIAAELPFHAGTFTGRSLYYPCEAQARVAAGYAISSRLNLVSMRGYDEALFVQRGRIVEAIFAPESPFPHQALLREVRKLGRPVAIQASGEGSEFLLWCKRQGHGRLLFRGDGNWVWLLGESPGTP